MKSSLRDDRIVPILLTIVFGVTWGLIEISLGGFFHAIHLPCKGIVLGGIGMALMASFVSRTGRPDLVLGLGAIAASGKLLGAVLLGISPTSPAAINPATAILLEAIVFRMVAAVVFRRRRGRATAHPAPTPGE